MPGTTPDSIHVAPTVPMKSSTGTAGNICLTLLRTPSISTRALRVVVITVRITHTADAQSRSQ